MKSTPIQLDKVRNLRFGMAAISKVEDTLGKSISEIDLGNSTMRQMATVLWAGMSHEDQSLTPDKVMELVDEYSSIKQVDKILSEALMAAFGAADEAKNERAAENSSR